MFVRTIGKYMDNRDRNSARSVTDPDVIAAAEKLSSRWLPNTLKTHVGGSQIRQRMGDGRSHVVAVETKRSPRRIRPDSR
jgi:hypothetical protein